MLARLILGLVVLTVTLSTGYISVTAPRGVRRTAQPTAYRSQNDSRIDSSGDLSGKYFGMFDYPAAGLSGVGTLVIDGKTFQITIESTTITGSISTAARGTSTEITMHFYTAPGGSANATISLIAEKRGKDLWLRSEAGEPNKFYFGTRPRERATFGRDPASVDSNTSTNTIATNANSTTIHHRRIRQVNDSGEVTLTSAPPPPRNLHPTMSPKATGSDNSNASSNTNTNAGFSSQLKGNANVAFTTPESMKLEETKDIELLVSPSESSETLVKKLSEPGKAGTGTTEYADRMEAKLIGTGFNITAASPEIQPVEQGHSTLWKWQIQPKAGGPQRLDLTLNAVVNDGKDRKLITTFKRDIRINVTWGQRASTFMAKLKDVQWLWAAIILPIAGAIYGWWRKKHPAVTPEK